jgi:hypothetical protein
MTKSQAINIANKSAETIEKFKACMVTTVTNQNYIHKEINTRCLRVMLFTNQLSPSSFRFLYTILNIKIKKLPPIFMIVTSDLLLTGNDISSVQNI